MSDVKANPSDLAVGINEKSKIDGVPKLRSRNFAPRREEDGTLALSTFCVDLLGEAERWALLQLHSNKAVCGRAELKKQAFIDEKLNPISDWDPERHVNIVGWPAIEEERKVITQALYDAQLFIRHPTNLGPERP